MDFCSGRKRGAKSEVRRARSWERGRVNCDRHALAHAEHSPSVEYHTLRLSLRALDCRRSRYRSSHSYGLTATVLEGTHRQDCVLLIGQNLSPFSFRCFSTCWHLLWVFPHVYVGKCSWCCLIVNKFSRLVLHSSPKALTGQYEVDA